MKSTSVTTASSSSAIDFTYCTRVMLVIKHMWSSGEGKFALSVLALWLAVSGIAAVWTPYSLWSTNGFNVWQPPSGQHWLGTDGAGADVLSWLMAGSGTDLIVVLATISVSSVMGVALLACMVAHHALLARTTVVLVDALISIPTVLIALIIAVPLGASLAVIIIACGTGYGLNLARVARPQAMLAAQSDYVTAARAHGASWRYVFMAHVLPNTLPVLAVQISLSAGTAILAEAGLTYLGIGVPSSVPSWGRSLAMSVQLINIYPLTVLWPGLVVTVVVVALNIFGDVLGNAVDPLTNAALRQARGGAA